MIPGIIYRVTHEPFYKHGETQLQEIVDISDNDNLIEDADEPQVIDIIPSGQPVVGAVIDSDEDVFKPVRPQKITINFNTDSGINMNTFASGSDNRWSVHKYISGKTLFKGTLVLDDMSEDFMPDPNIVQLVGTDGLGLLKDILWTDDDGNNPAGEYSIAEILAICLKKTGLELGIKAAFNIKLSGFVDDISTPNANDQHFFSRVWLTAKSFEDQIGTSISCYDVIAAILGEEAVLFQRQGYWWILRIDEVEHPTRGLYITEFDADGVFVGNLGEKIFEKSIGKDSPYRIFFAGERTLVIPTRPYKSVKTTYQFNTPLEVVPNIDFERGDLLTTVSATEKTYSIENWIPFFSNTTSDDAPTTDIYIRRIFTNDYETERYVVIEAKVGDFNFILSDPIKVGAKDKFILGIQRRIHPDISGSGFQRENHIQVRLYGNDGTFWTHQSRTSASNVKKWVQCDSTFRTNQKHFTIEYERESIQVDPPEDVTQEVGLYDGESAEIPVAGYLRIVLGSSEAFGGTNDTYYSGLSFDYRPYINGSHAKYTAFEQMVSQAGNYKAKRDVPVKVSDSPRPLFKGAFLKELLYVAVYSGSAQFIAASSTIQISGYKLGSFRIGQRIQITGTVNNNITARVKNVSYSVIGVVTVIEIDKTLVDETHATVINELTFELANEFYNAAVFPAGPPDSTYIHPYSEIQIFDIWNQFWMDKRIFQATLQGQDLDETDGSGEVDNAHLIHKWIFTDPNQNTNDRFFQLLTFDQNDRTAEWTGVFREVYKIDVLKQYTGRVSKYIS